MTEVPSEIRIGRAAPDSAVELLALQRTCFREEAELYGDPDIAPLTQTLDDLRADFQTQTVLGAWAGAQLVGSVRARSEQGVCQIGRLVVHPCHRRKGLGSALVAAIEATYPEAAVYEMFTGERSERNLRLYRRLGYAEAGSQVVSPRLTLVRLRKPGKPVAGTPPNPVRCNCAVITR